MQDVARTADPLLNVYRDVSKAMNMVEAGCVGIGSMFLETKVDRDDNSTGTRALPWGTTPQSYGSPLVIWMTQCYPPPDASECVPPNPSHAGWYLTYLPWRDGRLSCPSCLDNGVSWETN